MNFKENLYRVYEDKSNRTCKADVSEMCFRNSMVSTQYYIVVSVELVFSVIRLFALLRSKVEKHKICFLENYFWDCHAFFLSCVEQLFSFSRTEFLKSGNLFLRSFSSLCSEIWLYCGTGLLLIESVQTVWRLLRSIEI